MLSNLIAALSLAAAADTAVVPLHETIVTAARSAQTVLRTPAAVSVLRRGDFEHNRNISLADALQNTPGVFVQSRGGAQDVRITIRGYGARGSAERSNVGNMRGIRVLTDGIPVTEPDGRTSLDLVDLGGTDRIEVVRSNASALYGNASGGVIHLRTNTSFERPFFEYSERAGAYGYHREQGIAGFTLGQGRGTVSVLNSTFEGWRTHSQSYSTVANMRFVTPLDPETRLTLLLDGSSNLNRYPGALTAAELAADPTQARPHFVTRDERRRNRVGRFAVSLDRSTAAGQLLSAAAWAEPKVLQRSERNKWKDFTRYHVGGSLVGGREWKLASGATTRTLVGADEDYQDGAIRFTTLSATGGHKTTSLTDDKREGSNAAGLFAQQSYHAGPWTFLAAVRYDNLWYISENNLNFKLNSTRRFTHYTPKATVSYEQADRTYYAALGGGVESPAFNEIDPPAPYDTLTSFNPFLEPMLSTTYEVGSRGHLGGAWRYDAALYWIDVKNDIIPYNNGGYFFTAGKTRRRGAELALDWQPLAALTLGGTVTASRNEYVTYKSDRGTFDGNDVAGLPALVFGGRAKYRCAGHVTTELALNGNSKYFADDRNTIEIMQYGILDATIAWEHRLPRAALSAFVSGNNLLDKEYVGSAFINPQISGSAPPQVYEPGLPRNFSAGLTLRFR
ncbi:MAG: TonB-dependent receptor plug domain-containing protein [Candidatus Eisenbacteria bacterium]